MIRNLFGIYSFIVFILVSLFLLQGSSMVWAQTPVSNPGPASTPACIPYPPNRNCDTNNPCCSPYVCVNTYCVPSTTSTPPSPSSGGTAGKSSFVSLGDFFKDSGLKDLNFKFEGAKLGDILSGLLNIALLIAAFLAFYWLVWGAFQYILAKGDKEGLAKARARITWALIGLMVVFMAYLIATYAGEIFPATRGGLPF